ncbi:MAG: hypothetical protein WBO36_15620 [Saprospiraceae bacterium]
MYIIYQIYNYVHGLKYVVNKDIFDNMFIVKMIGVGIIAGLAIILKILGKERIASLVLGVPAAITVSIFIVSVLAFLLLAIVFILFGNK